MSAPVLHVVVDAANVIGARPDGWWRDRAGAARRLAGRLVAALTTEDPGPARAFGRPDDQRLRLHLVLEGAARVSDLPTHAALEVVMAATDGDSAIVEVAAELIEAGEKAVVVTADRGLRARVEAAGATVVGPGTLLRALPG